MLTTTDYYSYLKHNNKIKNCIKKLGFKQIEVSKQMGISYNYFTKLLQEPILPNMETRITKAVCELIEKRRKDENEFIRDYKKVVRQHAKLNK